MSACVTAPEILVKQPTGNRQYTMDFSSLLASNESLVSITSITHTRGWGGVSDLTVYNEEVKGNTVVFWISGGTDNITYRIEIVILTNAGQTFEGDGILSIKDK